MNFFYKLWLPLVSVSTWMVTSFAAFLTFPIKFSSTTSFDNLVSGVVTPLIALVGAFFFISRKRYVGKSGSKMWLKFAGCFFIGAIFSLSIFFFLSMSWTCEYFSSYLIVSYKENCKQLLENAAGLTTNLYPLDVLIYRMSVISLAFVATWAFLASLVFSLANSFDVYSKSRG